MQIPPALISSPRSIDFARVNCQEGKLRCPRIKENQSRDDRRCSGIADELMYCNTLLATIGSRAYLGRSEISITLLIIAARLETPILIITSRRNTLTVFGLICMREAISLLANPRTKCCRVSYSLLVRRYFSPSLLNSTDGADARSNNSAISSCRPKLPALGVTPNIRH